MTVEVILADVCNLPFEDESVDLVVGSPPYCDARTYEDGTLPEGHIVSRDCRSWVSWMIDATTEALRVCRGPVIWIAAGVTRDRNYWPACEGLMWEWFLRGGHAYRPCYWNRTAIPGSGGDQWFRPDIEYCMCFKRPGKLPFSDNTAMGKETDNRTRGSLSSTKRNGTRVKEYKYKAPRLANPGNLLRTTGGHLGCKMAHENEAPYPEYLAEFFIRSLCPPGGTVLDPFSGSGTTAAVAKRLGRNAIASDIRGSQVALTTRRVSTVNSEMAV